MPRSLAVRGAECLIGVWRHDDSHARERWTLRPDAAPTLDWEHVVGRRTRGVAVGWLGDHAIAASCFWDGQAEIEVLTPQRQPHTRASFRASVVRQLASSPDGRWIAVLCGSNFVVWHGGDWTSWAARRECGRKREFHNLAFHPSGRRLAAATDQGVRLYDTATWELADTFAPWPGTVRAVAFSRDGALLAAGGNSGRVAVWDFDA